MWYLATLLAADNETVLRCSWLRCSLTAPMVLLLAATRSRNRKTARREELEQRQACWGTQEATQPEKRMVEAPWPGFEGLEHSWFCAVTAGCADGRSFGAGIHCLKVHSVRSTFNSCRAEAIEAHGA